MRLELVFALDVPQLPVDNKRIWISFLKKSLSNCNNGRFFERYFTGTPQKDYAFSIIMPSPRFAGDEIKLDSPQVKMIFSADDKNKTGLIFFQAFIEMKHRRFPLPDGNAMTLKGINQLREKLITSSKVVFRTVVGGGLVVRNHNKETNKDKYYTFLDEGFQEQVHKNLVIQARKAGFSEGIAENVKLTPLQCKKVLVKQYGIYVDTTVGLFEMEGEPELLQYFYQAGLLAKHSLGYGLVDVISQENV